MFRIRRLCGPMMVLVLVSLSCLVCLSSGATSKTIIGSGMKPSLQSEARKPPVLGVVEGRSATDHHGRTLIFKSLILVPLAMVVFILLLILLIPIPVISNPIGRMFPSSSSLAALPLSSIQMARDVLTAEECVERVSCELSRMSRSYNSIAWIPSTLERFLIRGAWSEKVVRGINGTGDLCSKFICSPAKMIKRTFKME